MAPRPALRSLPPANPTVRIPVSHHSPRRPVSPSSRRTRAAEGVPCAARDVAPTPSAMSPPAALPHHLRKARETLPVLAAPLITTARFEFTSAAKSRPLPPLHLRTAPGRTHAKNSARPCRQLTWDAFAPPVLVATTQSLVERMPNPFRRPPLWSLKSKSLEGTPLCTLRKTMPATCISPPAVHLADVVLESNETWPNIAHPTFLSYLRTDLCVESTAPFIQPATPPLPTCSPCLYLVLVRQC